MFNFFEYIGDAFHLITDFFSSLGDIFSDLVTYGYSFYVYLKLKGFYSLLEISFNVAQLFINELGFAEIINMIFSNLPSEILYYFNIFGIPQGFSLFCNLAVTGFVLKIIRF